jgi:hypothetical protein
VFKDARTERPRDVRLPAATMPILDHHKGHSSVRTTADIYAHAMRVEYAAAKVWDAIQERDRAEKSKKVTYGSAYGQRAAEAAAWAGSSPFPCQPAPSLKTGWQHGDRRSAGHGEQLRSYRVTRRSTVGAGV